MMKAFSPSTTTTQERAKPVARPLGFRPAPPMPVETIDDDDMPAFMKTDREGAPPAELPHRLGFKPPRRRR